MTEPNRKFERQWDDTWSHLEAQPWYPDEQIVRFLARYIARRTGFGAGDVRYVTPQQPTGLDLGCGKGRHLITMAEFGINACGVDLSKVAVEFAQQWLASRQLRGDVKQGSIDVIPYGDGAFDFVICHGVLDHMVNDVRRRGIDEVQRVLKSGGLFFFSVISNEDSAYGQGQPIEEDTWILPDGFEKNIPQAFFSQQRIAREFAAFETESIVQSANISLVGRSLIGSDKHYSRDDRYYVLVRKK
ncbi:MAG: class I SAM-dependent methyltransferase [Gammaproteobacteria bacterium]|nr:class I SAM-dependent methyltransferase [Gammaproteobacteria bacterium]